MRNLMKKLRNNPCMSVFCEALDRLFREWGQHYSVVKHSNDYNQRNAAQAKIDKLNVFKSELHIYVEELGTSTVKMYRGNAGADAEQCLVAVNEAIDSMMQEAQSDPALAKYAKRSR